MNVQEMSTEDLRAEHKRLTVLKAWRGNFAAIERELTVRAQRVELAQDSYYYGTAADLR